MKNVLISKLLAILVLFASCKNIKSDVTKGNAKDTLADSIKDTFTNSKSESDITQPQDSVEVLYKESIKSLKSKNTHDIIYNNFGIVREFNLYYDEAGKIETPYDLHDSLDLDYIFFSPIILKININYKNRCIQKMRLIRYSSIPPIFDLVEKSADTLIFNMKGYYSPDEKDSILLVNRNDQCYVADAYHSYFASTLMYKKRIISNDFITDLTTYEDTPPKRIMRTNDFNISLNEKKETVFDVTFKTYGFIDGIPSYYKEFYKKIFKQITALDSLIEHLSNYKVNVINKKEGIQYVFKIFPVEGKFFPQEYKLIHNNDQTTSFVMEHKLCPLNCWETVYSDSIIFYKNTNKIKSAYRKNEIRASYREGHDDLLVKLKVSNNNGINEICGYFDLYHDPTGCIEEETSKK